MKKQLAFLFVLAFTSAVFSQDKINHQETAKTILSLLNKNEFNNVVSYFDTLYAKRLTPQKLERSWKNMTEQVGAYVQTKEVNETDQPNFKIVVQKCEFLKKMINVKIVFNSSDKVINFSVIPDHPRDKYELPDYYDSTKVREMDVQIISGELNLPGTLSLPATGNKFPVLVYVHGAGANDRDETVSATKMFKDISIGLALHGIASLRYDKRTKVYGGRSPIGERIFTVKEETIDDVIAAVKSLKNYSSIDTNRIFLLGHGFGGMLLPRIAKELPNLAGLIIMASNASRLEDIFYNESVYLLSLDSLTKRKQILLDSLRKQVEAIKHLTTSSIKDTAVSKRLLRFPKTYWVDLNSYNQTEVAKDLKVPIYILQGERDYQLSMKDFDLWKKELSQKKNARFKSYPKLNHLFIEGEGKGTPFEYDKKGNVASYVIDDLAGWITSIKNK